MTMMEAPLGEVAEFVRGVTFKPDDVVELGDEGSVACLRTKNVQTELDLTDVWAIPRRLVKSADRFVREGDIVVSTANSWNLVGKVSWIPRLEWEATAGGFVCLLRANPHRVFPRYLYHWIITDETQANLRKCARQTTNIANLSIPQAQELAIPLPPLEEQRRIAAILDQADALRCLRSRALDKLNTLGQAIFHEMFGDPATNPKNWPMGVIGDLLKEAKYGSSSKANSEGRGLPMLRMGNVTYDGRIDLSDLKHIELSDKEFEKYTTRPGDLLFNRTNSKELVGKTAVVTQTEPMAIAGYLVRARANARGDTHYISGYLNSTHGKAVLRGMCKNIVGMANINAREFQSIPIAIPPVELQRAYADKLASLRAEETKIQTSLDLASILFNSLQHRAFEGEL